MKTSHAAAALAALLLTSAARAQPTPDTGLPPPATNAPPAPPLDYPTTAPPPVEVTPMPADLPAEVPTSAGSVDPATATPETGYDAAMDPAASGAAEASLSAEELEALGFGGEGESAAVDTDIKVFGFADFSVAFGVMKDSNRWSQFVGRHTVFYNGNFNLFLSKALSENVRTMGEVRFHYAPHGSSRPDGGYIISEATDHADYDRPIHWGGVEIERLYIEWSIIPNLAVRAGQFLTPYGIWNVDHGSPLFIPVQRPFVIGTQLFPERQTGFEFFGKWDLSQNNAVGYHLTLSNGMGPISEIREVDDNKAIGGRLYWELRALGELRVGGSIFYGKDTTTVNTTGLDAMGALTNTERITAQSDVLSMAGDLQWRYRGWHLQAEGITQQRKWVDKGRFGGLNPLLGQTLFPVDSINWGVYGMIGYRFEWLGVMPYVLIQKFVDTPLTNLKQDSMSVQSGLNIRPLDSVVLKLEYVFSKFPNGYLISDDNIHLLQAQVAWTF